MCDVITVLLIFFGYRAEMFYVTLVLMNTLKLRPPCSVYHFVANLMYHLISELVCRLYSLYL